MFTLVFLLSVLGILVAFVTIIALLIRHQWKEVRNICLGLIGYVALYSITLIAVAVLTPQTILSAHAEKCFDEMCFSVSHVMRTTNLGQSVPNSGTQQVYYVVSVQLRNSSTRIAQKPDSPYFYLDDGSGHHIAIDDAIENDLGQSTTWSSKLQPAETQIREFVFLVSTQVTNPRLAVGEGGWPSPLIIGDGNSFFHKQAEIQLP